MAGTLKVKIQEDIILDNQDYGSKRIFEISSIANITKKIVSIAGDDDATVLVFKSTTASAGISLGSAIAVSISWSMYKSVLWAIIHGFFGWLYVIYYVITR